MFDNPFSFNGRIRRIEYFLSILFQAVIYFPIVYILRGTTYESEIFWILFFISAWFIFAQGAKRCHDISRNGFYQLIPFYFFWMIVEDGVPKKNKYGLNPKGLKGPEETGKIRQNER